MPLTTLGVAISCTPTFFATAFKHFLGRDHDRKGMPTTELSYEEGLALIKQFLKYAGTHTLEEVQQFTSARVPTPRSVHKEEVKVSPSCISSAVDLLTAQLSRDPGGLEQVGGGKWWQHRARELSGEWIEMKRDVTARGGKEPDKVLLYIIGGAYFFASLETHRYQIQRHARKLGARAFAPSYRLAPQFPFPCMLLDILASYLFLIDPPSTARHSPIPASNIILMGDSAGGGAILSLLIILRDQGIALPAGACLISPWVDLSHSFPSVKSVVGPGDYIPSEGFHYKPGLAWPPLTIKAIEIEGQGDNGPLRLEDQVQLYCPNALLSHPLVSPINQGNFGGLPPIMFICGSSELLCDEIIYLAHKVASPLLYPPSSSILSSYPSQRTQLDTVYPLTSVQLAVYDGCAHVTPTLSITSPAKYMYRGAANFGLWALSLSRTPEDVSLDPPHSASSNIYPSLPPSTTSSTTLLSPSPPLPSSSTVSITSTLPPFKNSMIRQRVSPKGFISTMEPISSIPSLSLHPDKDHIGSISSLGPIKNWIKARSLHDKKYSKALKKYDNIKRIDADRFSKEGSWIRGLEGDNPPAGSWAGWANGELARESIVRRTGENVGLSLWSKVSGAKEEKVKAIEREQV